MKPIHIFQFITNPVCGRYRFNIPAKYLVESGQFRVTPFQNLNKETYQALVDEADILIVQRLPYTPQFEKIVRTLNSLGKIVIYEIDDDLFNLQPESDYLKKAPPDYSVKLKQATQLCQAVQCSTRGLAETISEFHPKVNILENQLGEIPELKYRKPDNEAPTIIGYAAGENHQQDWLTIKDAVNQFAMTTENNVEFWILGDKEIYESIETENKKFIPLLSFEDYMRVLRLVDVSLMPLQDTKFNRSKSDVKFLESAAAGCAVLASRLVYGETIKHDRIGFLFSNKEEFSNGLKRLTEDGKLIHQLGATAYQFVESKRLMVQHKKKWIDVYKYLFLNRDEFLENALHKLQKNNG